MNLQQAKILLEKINSLYKSIDMDRGEMAGIERDLMLSYLRQLYEIFQESEEQAASRNRPGIRDTGNKTSGSREERPRPEPLRRTYKPPRIIEIPDSEKETPTKKSAEQPEENYDSKTSTPQEIPSPREPDPQPRPESRAEHSSPTPETHGIESLFEQRRATELSEKLSESPVSDLTKSMAINDRLLYMNELFGKSMNALDENLRQFNRYDNMEEAKPRLIELARRYDWTDEERMDTAKSFIKLVRRRYL